MGRTGTLTVISLPRSRGAMVHSGCIVATGRGAEGLDDPVPEVIGVAIPASRSDLAFDADLSWIVICPRAPRGLDAIAEWICVRRAYQKSCGGVNFPPHRYSPRPMTGETRPRKPPPWGVCPAEAGYRVCGANMSVVRRTA